MLTTFWCMFFSALFVLNAAHPDVGYAREQLQPLTNFRQQHRTTLDGRLCAAAFVQDRKTFTGPDINEVTSIMRFCFDNQIAPHR